MTENEDRLSELRARMVAAEHEYLACLRSIYAPRFTRETAGFVFDTEHYAYKLLFGKDKENVDLKDSITLYRKLIAVAHPDKCDAPWAAEMAQTINDASGRGDADLLRDMDKFYEAHGTFDGYTIDVKKADAVSLDERNARTKASLWHVWFFNNECGAQSMLKKCFVSPAEHARRAAERDRAKHVSASLDAMRAEREKLSEKYRNLSDAYLVLVKAKDTDFDKTKALSAELNAVNDQLVIQREKIAAFENEHGVSGALMTAISGVFDKFGGGASSRGGETSEFRKDLLS